MHIIVSIKQVPKSEEQRYDPSTRTLVREGITNEINAFDKRSLTEAIRLRTLYGGTITAITMGPPQAREALIECLGRGVDRCIHLTDRAFAGSDTLSTARTLAAALRNLSFDVLLLGKFTTDSETGQVGPELAELLDLPQVTGATAIELHDDGTLRITRETDTGFEVLDCPTPLLLTAAEHLIKPTKTKPAVLEEGQRRIAADPGLIEIWSAHDLDIPAEAAGLTGSPTWVSDLRPVEIIRARTLIEGDPTTAARALLAALEQSGLRSHADTHPRHSQPPLPAPTQTPDPTESIWAVPELLPNEPSSKIQNPKSKIRRVSLELAGEAARLASLLGGEAISVLMGSGITPDLCEQLARHGTPRILLADDPRLKPYSTDTYAWVLAEAITRYKPRAVLLPATSFGRDFAPRVAARLGLGLTGDCTGFELDEEGRLLQLKPAFGGQVLAPIISRTLPVMSTVRPGMLPVYAPAANVTPHIERLNLDGLPAPRLRVLSATTEGQAGLALDSARLIVCVGTGIGGPHALPQIEQLAQDLGSWMGLAPAEVAVGGTRKVVDEGWLPRHQQIGITGHAVAPDLYVALALQGNFNHTAGILRSGTIVAVNTDPEAPIFIASDFNIPTDWQALASALHTLLTQSPLPRPMARNLRHT